MTECPVCASIQIVYVVGPRLTTCFYCGATWIQDGTSQTAVHRPEIPAPMLAVAALPTMDLGASMSSGAVTVLSRQGPVEMTDSVSAR